MSTIEYEMKKITLNSIFPNLASSLIIQSQLKSDEDFQTILIHYRSPNQMQALWKISSSRSSTPLQWDFSGRRMKPFGEKWVWKLKNDSPTANFRFRPHKPPEMQTFTLDVVARSCTRQLVRGIRTSSKRQHFKRARQTLGLGDTFYLSNIWRFITCGLWKDRVSMKMEYFESYP